MPSWAEFRLASRGLLLLARFDPGFLGCFDRRASGALRSFWLAVFLLPFALVASWYLVPQPQPHPGLYMTASFVGYGASWILFPLLLLNLGRILERDAEMPGFIAVYNWSQLLRAAVQLPLLVLIVLSPDSGINTVLKLLSFVYLAAIGGFLLMRGLRLLLWQALALLALDILLTIALTHLILVLGRVHIPVVAG